MKLGSDSANCKVIKNSWCRYVGKSEQEGRDFRLYDLEVLELNSDVSFLLVLPPAESVCNSPFDGLDHESHDCTYVPVQAFEMCEYAWWYLPNTKLYIKAVEWVIK